MDAIEQAVKHLEDGQFTRATCALLLSIAGDTKKMLIIAEKNQRYIDDTMKEMRNDRGNGS